MCCFNGCVTTCGPEKVCKTVYELKRENVTKVMCQLEKQPQDCVTVTEEVCEDVIETVEEALEVEEITCYEVQEEVCEKVESEVCVPKGYLASNPVCPIVHRKPEGECSGQPTSSCWSPGVPDLDCVDAALCCFDGCYNHCLNHTVTCHTELVDDCQVVDETECVTVPETVCKDVPKPVRVPVTTTVCTKVGKSCMTMAQQICNTITELKCQEEAHQLPACKNVTKNDCHTVDTEQCTAEVEQVCETIEKEQESEIVIRECGEIEKEACKTVSANRCRKVEKEVCPDCEKTVVTNKVCKFMPREECKTEIKTGDKKVAKEVSKRVCAPKEREECEDVPDINVCSNVVSEMSYSVPVLVCE